MNRRATLAMTTALCLAVGLSASDALQQKSLKEQLVGTWTLVSSDQVRPDGSKLRQFGANPNGINVFDANGRFFLMMASADNLRMASNDRSMTKSKEDGLTVHPESGQNRSRTQYHLSLSERTEVQQPCCEIW
jgi:Lipocalin-like domain